MEQVQRKKWTRWAGLLSVAVGLALMAGCGEEKAPAEGTPPAKAAVAAPKTDDAMAMSGPEKGSVVTKVYVSADDKTIQTTPGAGLKEMPISNPNPAYCPVSGELIKQHTHFGIVDGKAYAFCCPMCLPQMEKDSKGVLTKAEDRAKTEPAPKADAAPKSDTAPKTDAAPKAN
ncbi:MAG: hypothetical protein ACREJ2_03590 [Planctomycetota bacterium]